MARLNLFRFLRDARGSMGIVFTIAIIPIIGIFGLAANYASANARRADYQAIADAAVLAGSTASTNDSDAARKTRATEWFNTQVSLRQLPPAALSVNVTGGVVALEATTTITPVMDMFGTGGFTVKVAATAQISTSIVRRVLDVAFCIDATGSMQMTIDSVKARAASFASDLNANLLSRGLDQFDHVRIRGIFYRDFAADTPSAVYYDVFGQPFTIPAMVASGFSAMPANASQLNTFLASQNAMGGGDEPESSYECINEGMSSDWFKKNQPIPATSYKADYVYPVIIIWSDANALPLPHDPSVNSGQYPANMPQTETTFLNKWNSPSVIDQENKMLVHFGLCDAATWSLARSMTGYMCGGTLMDGNTNMIVKIADAMQQRYKNLNNRLSR